ncbi:hypothetical protein GX408_15635 [bacterium]|nr:hypothetical protein [bacterium]
MKPSMGAYPETPLIRNSDLAGGMKEMSEKEMEQISAGATAQCKAWNLICIVANGATLFGGLWGSLLAGPTAAMCWLDEIIDYSHCP